MICREKRASKVLLAFLFCCGSALAQSANQNTLHQDALDTYTQAGQKALAAGHYAAAEENFTALAKLEPKVAEVHATLGLIYFQERNYSQAVVEIRLARKLQPSLTKLDSLLAMSLSELGSYKEALPGLEKAFEQSPDPAIKRMCGLQLMRAYTGLQQDGKAVEVALHLQKLDPSDPEVLYNTSRVFGNYAYLTVRQLARDAPNSVWRHLAAAEAYESQGSSNEAIAEYKSVLAIDPHRIGIHYRIGRTLLAQTHQTGSRASLDQARAEFEAELQLDPANGNADYELGEMHRQAGEFELAQHYFTQAIHEYPNFEEAQLGLAAVFIAEQKPADALQPLQSAIALNANDEVGWYRLSQVEKSLGNRSAQQDALAHFKKLHQQALDQNATGAAVSPDTVTRQDLGPTNNE